MLNSNSIISVIMSVYNHQDYVADAIESIINQTFTNLEFIIINDGSTDNSLDIIRKYEKLDSFSIFLSFGSTLVAPLKILSSFQSIT